MGKRFGLCVVVYFGLILRVVVFGQKHISVGECNEKVDYLDTTNLQCVACPDPPNKPLDIEGLDARVPDVEHLLKPYSLRSYEVSSRCTCGAGWIINHDDLFSTESCGSPLAVSNYWCDTFRCMECIESSSVDRSTCMTCGVSSNRTEIRFNVVNGRCECMNSDQVLIERGPQRELLPYKICQDCPANTVVRTKYLEARAEDGIHGDPPITEEDAYVCQRCPHSAMVVHNDRCVCAFPNDNSPKWTAVGVEGIGAGVSCVLTSESAFANKPRFAEIEYTHVLPDTSETTRRMLRQRRDLQASSGRYTTHIVRNSIIFMHYFTMSATRCRYLRSAADLEACQTLANLCVLQQFDESTPSCELMADIQKNRNQWNDVSWDWKLVTPWLKYETTAPVVTGDAGIEMDFSFNMAAKEGTYDFMQFVLAKYALNGTFLGWSNVTTQFEYCTPTSNQVPRWRKFGYGHLRTYSCNLFTILRSFPEPVFFDMYLVDYAVGGSLYPVPVRNQNVRDRNRFPNDNGNMFQEADDVLTRRFFLYDQISSKVSVIDEGSVIRFAKLITLTTTVQKGKPNRIYPPVLEILYEERLVTDLFKSGVDEQGNPLEATTNVDISFVVEYTEDYGSFWSSTSAFFGITSTIVALLALTRLFNWSRRNSRIAGDAPVDFVFVARGISYVFSTFASVFFWFLFAYSAYFFVFFKMQDNIHLLLPVNRNDFGINNDYFPFALLLQVIFVGQVIRMGEIVLLQTNIDIFFMDWEKPRGRIQSKRGDGTKTKFAPISIWRTIFMANEWNEIQLLRRYDLELALLLLATILIAGDVQYTATPTPNYKDLTPGELNVVLRFFNTSFWFLLIASAQMLFKWAIQDRYFTEPPTHSFVDLCTIAKVSVLILDEKYHGYYLHCRSQHEFADCSMLEIAKQLHQEEQGLTTDRGLPGCPERGLQTFEIYVTGEWKRQYNHIYRTMMTEEMQGAHADASSFLLRVMRRRGGKPAAEKLVRASRKLNAFLRSFIDQDSTAFPIQHREQTFMHRFMHTPPEMMSSKDNIFFPDPFYQYDRVLYYGQTWNLLLFNAICIGTFDFWWGDTMLSIFLAYLIDRFFMTIRELFGNANLSTKTLVDDRFLI